MQQDEEEIVRCGEDEYSRWEVNKKGYVRNEVGKPMEEVMEFLKQEITNAGINLEEYDYFQAGCLGPENWPVLYRRIVAFAIPGGNEGHYIHLDIYAMDGKVETIVLGKTFMGMDHALELSNCLSRILDWNYKMVPMKLAANG
jgi:hypothetical protein